MSAETVGRTPEWRTRIGTDTRPRCPHGSPLDSTAICMACQHTAPSLAAIEQRDMLIESLARAHEAALLAINEAFLRLADGTAKDAIEYLGDWANGCDAVGDDAVIAAYDRWNERGNP